MGVLSPIHWLIFLTVVILVFGTKKLRNAGKDLGGAVKEFKNAVTEESTVHQPVESMTNDTIDSTASEKMKQQEKE